MFTGMGYPDRFMKHRRTTACILNVVMKNYKDFVYSMRISEQQETGVGQSCLCHYRLFAPDMIMCY